MKRRFLLALSVTFAFLIVFGAASANTPNRPDFQATALATFAPTDDGGGIDIVPRKTTPTPTVPPTGKPGGGFNNNGTPIPLPSFTGKFEPPPTLEELLKQFPELKPYVDANLNMDQVDLGKLYKDLLSVYQKSGGSGLAAFLKDSGLLDKFGLPVEYLDLLMVFDKEGLAGVAALAKDRGYINTLNEVRAYITPASVGDLGQIINDMTKLGVTCYPPLNAFGQLEVGIPLDILATYQTPGTLIKYLLTVAQVKNIAQISAPIPKQTNERMSPEIVRYLVGSGPKFIGAEAWQKAGITGKGIRVGVLDLEFGGVKDLANDKDLPKNLKAAQDLADLNEMNGNHGTACAQVVHGIAPDAEIFVGLADSDAHYEQSINFFIKNKVHIISYSVGSAVGPRDGTFGEALAVDEIVDKTGVLWLTAAGNEAVNHTLFDFKDEDGDGLHDFDGENAMPFIAFDPTTSVTMNWNGNWKGTEKNEYTFTIFDSAGDEVATGAEAKKGRKQDFPFQHTNFRAEPESKYFITIERNSKAKGNATIDLFVNNGLFPESFQVLERSVTTPADSNASLTVGATGLTKDKIEFYSSQGPTMDGRIKPDVSAPTGEKVTGHPEGFSGTSGATPLVAGAAALWYQAFPGLTAGEARAALIKNVVDLGKKGPDPVFGAGRIKLPDPTTINADKGPDTDTTPEPIADDGATVTPSAKPTKTPKPSVSAAAAEVTETGVKFNVTVKGVKGIQVSASFNIDNFKGKPGAIIIAFYESDGKTTIKPKTKPYTVAGTLGTYQEFTPKYDSSEFSKVPLFLPNAEFGNLPKGDNELVYIVGVLDLTDESNPVLLAKSSPESVTVSRR